MGTTSAKFTSVEKIPKQLRRLFLLILVVVLVGVLGNMAIEGMSPTGAFIRTIEILSDKTIQTSPQNYWFHTFLKLIGVITFWFAIWAAFDLTIVGHFDEYLTGARIMKKVGKLKNHFIICGAGRVGKSVGLRLKQHGVPVVFIEKEPSVANKLLRENHLVIQTDAMDEKVLKEAGVECARAVIATLGDDSKNLLLLLTAKELNPHVKVAARLSDMSLIKKFKRAGADYLIIPEIIGGVKLADALMGYKTQDVLKL